MDPRDPSTVGPSSPGPLPQLRIGPGGPWPFVILGLALLGVGLSFWRPVPGGVWHDDGVYLLIGKALASGEGLTYAGVPGDLPAVKFPPLYPVALAGLWLVLGGLGPVTLAAVLANLVLLAAAGTLLALALERSAGLQRTVAMVVGGLAIVSADVWRVALVALSEPLFMALTAAALLCWPSASRPTDRRGAMLLALVLTAAMLTRSAGAALVLGFAVALVLARGLRAALAVVALPVAAGVAWGMWAATSAQRIPEGMRDVLGPYGSWLTDQLLGAPTAFVRALPAHLLQVLHRIFVLLLPGLDGIALWAAAVPLAALIAIGLALLHRRFPPVAWVAVAYFAMLLLWPFVDRRLVTPLHPLLVVTACTAVIELWQRSSRRTVVRASVGAVAFLWVGLLTSVGAWRASTGWAADPYRLRAGRLAAAVETLQRTAPPDAVVGAPEFWAALHLHGGWHVTPSALFTPRADDEAVPVWGTPREQIALWWDAGIDHLLMEQGGQLHGDALNLIEERCPGAVGVLATMPPQMLVRLEWDEACAAALGLEPREPGP